MATTAAERKAKQRQEMLEKGFVRKDLWLSEESIRKIEEYKVEHNLKSYDDALNKMLSSL